MALFRPGHYSSSQIINIIFFSISFESSLHLPVSAPSQPPASSAPFTGGHNKLAQPASIILFSLSVWRLFVCRPAGCLSARLMAGQEGLERRLLVGQAA